MPRMRTLISVLLLAGVVYGQDQDARYGYFGSTCEEPRFSFIGLPRIGTTFFLRVQGGSTTPSGVVRATSVIVLTGFSRTSYGSLKLPLSLFSVLGPLYQGALLTSIADLRIVESGPHPGPIVSVPYTVPNDRSLAGCNFYQQLLTVESFLHVNVYRMAPCAGHGIVGY